MKTLYFITTNDYKYKKFTEVFQLRGYAVEQLKIETPEIQAANNRLVAEFSAQWAANQTGHPVIKEDVGVYIEELGGFPGVYLSDIEKQLKSEGFLQLLTGRANRSAYWEYAVAICQPGEDPISFATTQPGLIAEKVAGESGWFMDKIFIPEGSQKTVAELLDADEYVRNQSHYSQLIDYLRANNN